MAIIEPREVTLKDGAACVLRVPDQPDAEAVFEYAREHLAENVGSIRAPEEFDLTVEKEREWIAAHRDSPDALLLIADLDGVAGLINFKSFDRKRLSHVGGFGVGVRKDVRGRGIGRALIETLLEWAHANPRIEKVSLQVLADNENAIALYRKLGFVEEGRRPGQVRYEDGRHVDDVLMYVMV
jgi:RimJ/RimL family protein N-acetyltransferase